MFRQKFARSRIWLLASSLALTAVAVAGVGFLVWTSTSAAPAPVAVWTQHNDNFRTGANLAETQLTTATVNTAQFGRLFSYTVDADTYAQPLIIPNVAIAGKGVHNVLFVATMNNSVYAFDADSNRGGNAAPLWSVSFNDPANGVIAVPAADAAQHNNIRNPGTVGVMGTPVIDQSTGTMYLIARTKETTAGVSRFVQRLHALNISNGAERFGGPVEIQASVPGSGYDAVGGLVKFNTLRENQRSALALGNGLVYIMWASIEDRDPYHGWIMAYDVSTLNQVAAWCVTPNGSEAGIWQAGQGAPIDEFGNVYATSGNGTFTANTGGRDYGEAVVKLSPLLATVTDWFAPDNWAFLNGQDLDFGSSGPLLIPDTNLIISGGKAGTFFLMDRSNLGHVLPGNTQIVQSFQATSGGHIHGSPVYWNGPDGPTIYVMGEQDYLKAFRFNGLKFATTPITRSTFTAAAGMPGGILSVSANGATPGSGIVWAAMPIADDAEGAVVPGTLRAFDATDLTHMLWSSQQTPTRDPLGNFAKYVAPTVANGRVYMATFSNQVVVYGLLNSYPPPTDGALAVSAATSSAAVDLTTIGTSDWARWPAYATKASGSGQISDVAITASPNTNGTYTNDPRILTWSDGGNPVSGSTQSGLYVNRSGSAYTLSAPADTTPRTLTVYVGGWNSTGYLTAHLSDGSAPDVIGAQIGNAAQYDVVQTIVYRAASAGQRLIVQWTQFSGSGNLTIQAAALAGGATLPPAVPTNVVASDGTSSTSVSVTWSAVSDATSYTVYRSTTAGSQGTPVGAPTGPSFVDGSVTPGLVYYYGVRASNGGGTSALSAQDGGYASAPTGGSLVGAALTSTTPVNLTTVGTADWIRWPGTDHKATGGGKISPYTVLGGNVLTYTNDPRTVTWTDGAPTASGSTAAGVYVLGDNTGFRVSAPADTTVWTLTVYAGGYNSTAQLTATLSDGSALAYVSAAAGRAGQYDATYQLTYSAASAGQTLVVQWKQLTSVGEWANVTLQAATLAAGAVSAPGIPTNVVATDGTASTVGVSWTAVSGATSYTVYRSATAGAQGTAIGTPTSPTFTDSTAAPGTTYYYGVAASNAGGTSALSAQDSGYAAVPSPPGAPTNVSASDGTSTANVQVTWAAVGGATSYTVYRSASAGTQGTMVGVSTVASFADGAATQGVVFYYGVTATGPGGTSGLSAQDSGYRALSTPTVPTGVAASDGTSTTSVSVTWNAVSGAANYTVYRSTALGTQGTAIGTPTSPTFLDATATPGLVYYYGVTASNGGGTSALSTQDSGYASAPTGSGGLTGAALTSTTPVNLTTVGTADWVRWPGTDHKATGGSQISGYTVIGGSALSYTNDPRTVTWTDGSPTASGSTAAGVYVLGNNTGFRFTVPADTTVRTLTVYVGGYNSTAQLTATLSDSSAPAYVSPVVGVTGQYNGTYQVTYSAASAGQTLAVQWKQMSSLGEWANVTLQAAALTGGSLSTGSLTGAIVAPASTVDFTASGTTDWAHWPGYDHKAAGGGKIQPYAMLGGATAFNYANDPRTITWSDGTPTASGSTRAGIYAVGVGAGFRLTVPADTTLRTLTIYVGGWSATGQLTATLSDGSAPSYVSPAAGTTGQFNGIYQVTYAAASAGKTLTVQWKQVTSIDQYGNVTLQGATLK